MKHLRRILALIMVVALMAGCTMKENVSMKIAEDGNIKITVLAAMDDEMIDGMLSMSSMGGESSSEQKTYTDAERWAYLEGDNSSLDVPEEGWTSEKYDKDGFKGYTATKDYGNIEKVSAASADKRVNIFEESSEEGKSSDMFKGTLFIKDGNKYKSNMTIDLGESSSQMSSYESYGAAFDMKLVIELPSKAISNNATEVSSDGKTLTYDLLKSKDIEFEFELGESKSDKKSDKEESSDSNILLFVIIGIVALLVVVVIVVVIVSSSKKKAAVQQPNVMGPVNQQPVQPTDPQDPNNMNNPQV